MDTGVDIDSFTPNSRIYVSEDTVGEWARMLGWISPDDAHSLTLEKKIAVEEMTDLLAEVERLRVVESALIKAGFTLPIEPPPEDEPEEEITYPYHKGAGWWLLSNGARVRGSAEDAAEFERLVVEGVPA